MADTGAEPLPVGLTTDRALPKRDTVTDTVDEIWKGKETLVSQSHRVAPGPAPVELEPEEMSMHANSLDISDHCGGLDAEDMDDGADDGFDPVIEEIKKSLSKLEKANQDKSSTTSLSSAGASEEGGFFLRISENFTSVPFGLQPRDVYEHGKKSTDIMGVTYNGRMRQFILLDSKGIVSWKRDAVDNRVTRSLFYPKYEYRLITYLVYARKYNCYFALWKDFSLKVLNRDFCETCSISADLRSVLFMLFNPIRDELITGGVEGTRVYHFHQAAGKVITELKPLANYQLTLRYELPNVGGSWVKKVELDYNLEHLYCCSDTDLYVYNLEGKQLFKFERAHNLSITGCRYSVAAKVLVTSSLDTEVKVWSMTGGLVHTFRGHSRAVTNLLIHPHNSTIVITCSLDGSLRMWSLDTMDALYSLVVSASGLLWMGLTDDNLLYISTARSLTLWHLNHFHHFWSLTRNQVTQLQLEGCGGKTQRVLAVGEDSSIRLFARSNQKNLSTVLPPPNVSPLQKILGVCYSREFNVIFVLINPKLIWVYTTRTDPACRIAVWDVLQIQTMRLKPETGAQERALLPGTKPGPSHRATENGAGNELPSSCLCVCILKSSAMVWTDEGCCCPVRHSYLLLGMEDGRVLFMDPVVKGHKYMEFKVTKDPVVGLHHDVDHQCLVTVAQMTQLTYVQYWSLPDLELIHEVFCAPDLTAYARIGYMCVTAHESGCVLFHTLEMASDPGLYKARMMPEPEDVIDMHHRPEHMAPVITVDACVPMKIFCSCSKDGAIKVWEDCGALLTEIMLDDTLSAACFLNKSADLIVAFQKHIFFISHTKVCPHLKPLEPEDHTFDKESYVYEDPAVVYEGVVADPDPIDLENYLVPFEIEFSKDFLEGKVTLEPQVEEIEDSDEEGRLSLAPTEIYLSPPSTPGSLSMVDLTLGSEVTKYDLLQQMKSTLQILIEKQQRRHMRRKGTIDAKDAIAASQQEADRLADEQKHGADAGDKEERGTFQMNARRFEFPRFDGSPGPSPTLTPSSTPELVSEAELSEVEESDSEDQMKDQLPPKKIPDMQLVAAAEIKAKVDKGVSGAQKEDLPAPKRTRKAIGDMEIDVASLMKGSKQAVPAAKKEGDHSHAGRSSLETWETLVWKRFPQLHTEAEASAQQEKSQRAPVKKKSVVQRKLPKRGLRPAEVQDGPKDVKDHPTVASGQDETHASVHDAHEESKDDTTETISVKIKRVGSASSGKSTVESEGESKVQAEAPPLPSAPAPAERPPSSKSVRSMKSADVKKHPMEFLTNRTGVEVGVSPTAELESTPGTVGSAAASVADAAGLSRAGSPHAPSEWEDLNRTKSQMSWASSREGHGEGQYLAPEEEDWDLSMDEILFFSQTRAISPASSVFTLGPRDSPMKGDQYHQRKGDFQLSRLLDSRLSYSTEEAPGSGVTFIDSPTPPPWMDGSRRNSAALSRATSPVKPRKNSSRPKSAASSGRRSSSSLSSSKRPKSAAAARSQKRGYGNYKRSESKDNTSTAEQLLSSLSRSSVPPSTALLPQSPSVPSAAASEYDWDSTHVQAELYRAENQHRPGSLMSSPPVLENMDESLCKWSRLPDPPLTPVCPPSCVCQLPQAERDAAPKRRKKISFQADQLPGEDLDGGQRRKSSSSGSVSPIKGNGLDPDKPIPKDADDISRRPPIATPAPIQPVSPLKRNRIWSQDSDAMLEEHDLQRAQGHDPERAQGHGLERAQGHDDGGFVSPRLPPPTPGVSPSPRPRFPSVTSSQNAVPSSATSCMDATGRESVMSGAAYPSSVVDSLSERMGSPDSALPDGELAFTEQESPGGADEDEHRAWSRIGLPDSSLMDAGRPSTTLLPARHSQLAEGLMRQRPFTAAHTSFQTELGLLLELPSKAEELRAVFEAAYHRYQKVHGNVPGDGEKLYSNKGVNFEDKWQERVLERHMLLRMQRVLRTHAAQQRRQMMQQQRVKSAPQQKRDFSAGQQPQSRLSRPNTAHPSLRRNKTTTLAPAPTPTGSRPTTATGRSQIPTIEQQKQLSQEKRQQWQAQKDKKNLSEEQPFRLRIREPMGESPPQSPRQHRVRIDPWLLDPRNPSALRPPSSKSIPSKCSRYVLLSRPRTVADVPAPTPLEEELLASRFPDQSVRLLKSAGAAVRPTPPHTSYGITYSPFSMYG